MIYCERCGLANRAGSRYCNNCGSPLGTISVSDELIPDWLRSAALEDASRSDRLLPEWVERTMPPGALDLTESFEPEEIVFSDELDEEGPRESDLLVLDDLDGVEDDAEVMELEAPAEGWLRSPRPQPSHEEAEPPVHHNASLAEQQPGGEAAERFREAARYMMTPEETGGE